MEAVSQPPILLENDHLFLFDVGAFFQTSVGSVRGRPEIRCWQRPENHDLACVSESKKQIAHQGQIFLSIAVRMGSVHTLKDIPILFRCVLQVCS